MRWDEFIFYLVEKGGDESVFLFGPNISKVGSATDRWGSFVSFFRGGRSRRLVNASHILFCMSASQLEAKLDLGFHGSVLREKEW